MSAPAKADELIHLVRKSQLVDESRLGDYLKRLSSGGSIPADSKRMAGAFVRDGFLTFFQAEQLLQGKYRGFTLGKYKILERLGYGGMGQVFLCEHQYMRRRVAIKVLPPVKAQEPSALARFYREARATAALDHPNIIRSHDVDQDGALHFLVMEYVDGVSLLRLVKKHGPLEPSRAAHYIRQAAEGLQHAHEAGLVHRDLKPGNLMVDREGVVKMLDLGLARFSNETGDPLSQTDEHSVLGTADYVAPEQTRNSHSVDIRADVYALGGTLYYLLTGAPPFPDGTIAEKLLAHQEQTPRPIRELCEAPAGLVSIVEKMLAKQPVERFQTPMELANALEPFAEGAVIALLPHELPRLSPAATAPSEARRLPVVSHGGSSHEPFDRSPRQSSGESSLSQFNLPPGGSAGRPSHPASHGSESTADHSNLRDSKSETKPKLSASEDTAESPKPRPIPMFDSATVRTTMPLRWLFVVIGAAAAGAGVGLWIWSMFWH